MSKFKQYLLESQGVEEAYLISGQTKPANSKEEYIANAEEGTIVAFRLNFTAKSGIALTKVISGKVVENNGDENILIVETRNGLRYGVPYTSVVWVKTGNRWPKGVYEEMKQGSVPIEQPDTDTEEVEELENDLGGMETDEDIDLD